VLVASIARSQTPLSSRACGANQLGEAQALSSLARRSYRRLSRSAERSCTTRRHARCAPARRATATVVWPVSRRVTPRRMWFNSIASIPRSQPAKRKLGSDLRGGIFFTTPAPPAQSHRLRPGVWSPDLSVEKPLVEKRRAAAPRTCGIISTERVRRLHAWSQICDCAGGAVVKMPSLQ
jgi:hypothetical protein